MALTVSKMTGGSNAHETTSEEANGLATDFVSEGIIGSYSNTGGVAPATGAFAVNAQGTPDMTVAVSSGVAYVTGTPTSQNSQTFRVYNSASENVTISANSSGSTKYDWVYIKLDATLLANPTLAGTTTATLVTSRSTSAGTDDGTPPTYGYPVAVVTVANGAVSITNSTIRDIRATASIGTAAGIATGWNETGLPAVSSVTNNGNRSYSVVFASTVASLLSPGMRLRTTRTVTAPTQCADLEASSSQYFSRASGSLTGVTFTDDFVVSAWVKLESYAAGTIASRYNGTSGWGLELNASGQILMTGRNGGAGNVSYFTSYQSIPLGKWVHVAGQLDMSAFTATTTTSYLMIDGVDVPVAVARAGTNPTALIQAGDLQIGAFNAGQFFDGKIAQVAVFSAKVTQSTMRGYISQGLTGSETSLVCAYSFNNVLTDLSANANTLTAQGGALATNSDSPFGNEATSSTLDYALITSVSASTITVQVPSGCTIPTSGTITSFAYSTNSNPYGWVVDTGKWEVRSTYITRATQSSPVNATAYNLGSAQISIPTGAWRAGYEVIGYVIAGAGTNQVRADLNTTSATYSGTSDFASVAIYANSTTEAAGNMKKESPVTLSSQTIYYLNGQAQFTGATNALSFLHDFAKGIIYAMPAGL